MLSKRNTFTLFITGLFLFNVLNATVEIAPSNLFIPTALKGTRLFHEDGNFVVVKDGQAFPINPEYTDKELRNLSDEELDFVLGLKAKININGQDIILTRITPGTTQELLANSNDDLIQLNAKESGKILSQLPVSSYIKVLQYDDGQYGLHLMARLPGGGGTGAVFGAWLGKIVASAVCHTVILAAGAVVSAVATPAVGAVFIATAESTLATPIEIVTTTAALATGMTFGVATGPV